MSIKDEVENYLKQRGTPATPKHIAKEIGCGTAGNIARALRDLVAEGKITRKTRPVQNGWVTYEWNPNYSAGITGGTVNKFTVGSEWQNKKGERAKVLVIYSNGYISVRHNDRVTLCHYLDGTAYISGLNEYDLIAPWSEPKPEEKEFLWSEPQDPQNWNPKPEEKSGLRELYSKWLKYEKHSARYLFEAIITEIEKLQKPSWKAKEEIITVYGHKVYLVQHQDETWRSYSVAEPLFYCHGETRDDAIGKAEVSLNYHKKHPSPLTHPSAAVSSGEVWVNVYPNCRWVHACATKAEADTYATETRLACVRVPWTEGEGL